MVDMLLGHALMCSNLEKIRLYDDEDNWTTCENAPFLPAVTKHRKVRIYLRKHVPDAKQHYIRAVQAAFMHAMQRRFGNNIRVIRRGDVKQPPSRQHWRLQQAEARAARGAGGGMMQQQQQREAGGLNGGGGHAAGMIPESDVEDDEGLPFVMPSQDSVAYEDDMMH